MIKVIALVIAISAPAGCSSLGTYEKGDVAVPIYGNQLVRQHEYCHIKAWYRGHKDFCDAAVAAGLLVLIL